MVPYSVTSNHHTSYDPGIYHDHDRSSIKSKGSQNSMSTVSTSSVANKPDNSDQTPNSGRPLLYIPNSMWTRMFATTMVTEMVFTVAIKIWVLMSLWNHLGDDTGSTESRLQSFLGLYVFGLLYELALSYDALRRRNTIQLVGLFFCNLGLTAYGVLQMQEIRPTLESMIADSLIDMRLFHLYRALRAEFLWSIYKNISADLQMRRRYLTYQVYITLLKFDFFFVFGTQLQFLLIVVKFESIDFIFNATLIPVAITSLVLSSYYCKREKRKPLIGMMFLMLITIIFLVLAIIRVNHNYTSARMSITLFATFSLLLLVATLVNTVLCILNFDQGLMTHVNPPYNDSASLELKKMETPTRFLLS
ncbi:hypothetical protein N7493_011648 [Penicillium malachiteum]|uniref:Uncharacterized protein n=1 Tax=Penicillium malachiteum TaxID=1324776 RepID=A0AAD6HA89_9EURO|nr:hypothetical protein N7493_011648 [Penicillium malachiteum]